MGITVDPRRAELLKKYFGGKTRLLPVLMIIAGVPLTLFFGFGLLLIGAGLFLISRRSSVVEDAKVDAWTDEIWAKHDYVTRAKEMSGFGALVREPVLLRGGASDDIVQGAFTGERFGDDGYTRRTPISATVILASEDQLGIYQSGIDLVTCNRVNERFLEVFYQDVVAISIGSTTEGFDLAELAKAISIQKRSVEDLAKGDTKARSRKFLEKFKNRYRTAMVADIVQRDLFRYYKIEFVDGDKISIPVFDGRPTVDANVAQIIDPSDEAAKSMQALRMFVRDKKRGFLRKEIAG